MLLPVGLLIALGLFAQKRASGFLSYYIKSLALAFDGMTPVVKVNLVIQNPSNEQFVVRSLVATLFANGEAVGNVSAFTTITVNPNSQQILPVYVRLNTLSIVSDIVTLFQNNSGIQMTLNLKGVVNANSIVAPIDVSYKIL